MTYAFMPAPVFGSAGLPGTSTGNAGKPGDANVVCDFSPTTPKCTAM